MSYQSYTDHELLCFVADDNHAAYKEIYKRYAGVLYVHARKKLHDREEARDLIQELFVSLWNNRFSLTLNTQLSSYLYRAVRYRIINHFVRRKLELAYVNRLKETFIYEQQMTDYHVRESLLKQLIEKEVDELPPKMRKIFYMSRGLNFSHREIAEQLNLSEATVKKQVNNALKVLRVKLGILLIHLFVCYLVWFYN